MDMKEILSNEFAIVSYDSESSSIITVWKKPVTSEAYRVILSFGVEKLVEYKAEALISDIFQQGIVGTENRLWLQNELLPKAYAGGLKKVATITPNDVFSMFYIESVKSAVIVNSLDLEFRYFQDLTSARTWAMEEEVPA